MTADPATTPTTRATCCRQGVASTSWPVLRSCRLSLALTATARSMAVISRAKATSGLASPLTIKGLAMARVRRAAPRTARMAMPDTGLFDEPIKPAM